MTLTEASHFLSPSQRWGCGLAKGLVSHLWREAEKKKRKNSELLYVLFWSLIRTANRVIIVLCTHSAPEQGLRTERVGAGREEKNEKKTRTGSR